MYEHFMSVIDSYYDAVAEDNGKADAHWFVEKASYGMLPAMIREMYRGAKEVFLVRDLRDMYASIVAFNKKRGFADFHADRFEKEEDYIAHLGSIITTWVRNWEQRGRGRETSQVRGHRSRPAGNRSGDLPLPGSGR